MNHDSLHRLTSILLSSFILDLRAIYLPDDRRSEDTQRMTSVQFAATLQDNLGAPLHASWLTGTNPSTEDEAIRYSEHPFVTGLLESGPERQCRTD